MTMLEKHQYITVTLFFLWCSFVLAQFWRFNTCFLVLAMRTARWINGPNGDIFHSYKTNVFLDTSSTIRYHQCISNHKTNIEIFILALNWLIFAFMYLILVKALLYKRNVVTNRKV